MSSVILGKVLYPDIQQLFKVYQVNTTNEIEVEYNGSPTGINLYSMIGYYSGGITPLRAAENGNYASVLTIPLNLHRNTLRSISLNASLFDVSGHSRNISANLGCNFSNFNTYTQASFLSENFSSFPANPISLSGFITNKPYPTSPDYTFNLDITSGVIPLNQSAAWNTNSYLSIAFNPSSSSIGVRDITYNYVSVTYYARVPDRPINILASGSDKSAFVSWNNPQDDGGSSVTGYNVQYYDLTDSTKGWISYDLKTANTGLNILNLINEHDYIFRVSALNLVGMGSYSIESSPVTPEEPKIVTPLNFNSSNYTRLRLRRDTSENWSGTNPILAIGEPGYETDTKKLKIGDNVSEWNDLEYIKVDNSSIEFPDPPTIRLNIGDSATNLDSTRMTLNLSDNEKLNLVGGRGIDLFYNDAFNAIVFDLDQVFTPFNTGTLYSPSSIGRPGEVFYDENYIYFCVAINSWKRIKLPNEPWFAADQLAISNNSGDYPSITNISFSGSYLVIDTDGDPYPAKASTNLVNDGINPRLAFFNNYEIIDQNYHLVFRYRGGTNTLSPEPANSGFIGIFNNGVLLSNPSAGNEAVGLYSPPSGFHYNRTFFSSFFKLDDCGGYVDFDRKYSYYNGRFLNRCWNDSKVYSSNSYYSGSHYNDDYFRHGDGHSKILGFCYDGYPIYGPFGYTDSENPGSISLMTSSYVLKGDDSHRPINWKYTNAISVNDVTYNLTPGAFVEDFYYAEGSGILDQYNGRYAVTPEYPEGTYAYYLTFTSNSLLIPAYPYIIGNYSKQQKISQQLLPSISPLTVDGHYPVFTTTIAAQQYGLLNGGDGSYVSYTIQGTNYYMPNGVIQKLPSSPTNIVLSENKISEKATFNSIIGTLSTTDPNTDDIHTYSLVSGIGSIDNSNFVIINNELRVNTLLSHDIKPLHNIRIRTTDQTFRFYEKEFTIQVLPGTTFTSLNITSGISSLVAGNIHSFGTSVDGTATDFIYSWFINGTPYITSMNGLQQNLLTVSGQNIPNRHDENVNIGVTVKSISAFSTLSAIESFVLDHSENPLCISGYYPLYSSVYDAKRYPEGDGTAHLRLIGSVQYWMPNGLPSINYGNYNCDSL